MAKSKYSIEERLEIGKKIFEGELSRFTAATRYDISPDTARNYLRYYKAMVQESKAEDD